MAGAGAFSDLVPDDAATARQMLPVIDGLERSGAAAQRLGVPVEQVTSPKGALGQYQVMPSTGALYGFGPDDLRTPQGNTSAALATLADLADQFGPDHKDLIAAGYNGGPGRARAIAAGKPVPDETSDYYSRALKLLANLNPIGQAEAAPASDPFSDLEPGGAAPAPAAGDAFSDLVPQKPPGRPATVTPGDWAFMNGAKPHEGILNSAKDFVSNLFSGGKPETGPVAGLADTLDQSRAEVGAAQDTGSALAKIAQQTGLGFEKSAGGLLSFAGREPQAVEATQDPAMVGISEVGRQLAATPAQRRAALAQNKQVADLGDKISKAATAKIKAATPDADAPWTLQTANTIGVGIGQMLPGLIGTVLTKSAAPIIAQTAATSFGSNYADEIARNPQDRNGAALRASTLATVDTAATAIGIKAFGLAPFKTEAATITNEATGQFAKVYQQTIGDMIKNVMLQGLAVQPAIGIVNRAVDNWVSRKPITQGLSDEYATAAIQNTLMLGLTHLASRPRPTLGKVQEPQPGLFDQLGGPPPPEAPPGTGPTSGPTPPPGTGPVNVTPDRTTGLVPIHDPVTWTQTGWRDAAGNELPLSAIDEFKAAQAERGEKAARAKSAQNGPETVEPGPNPPESRAPAESVQPPAQESVPAPAAGDPLVAQVDQAFKARMAAAQPDEPRWAAPEPARTSEMVAHAIQTGTYNDALHPANKNARATFEEVTGVKLPATVSGTKAAFKGQPFQAVAPANVAAPTSTDIAAAPESAPSRQNPSKSVENPVESAVPVVPEKETQQAPGYTTNPAKIRAEHEAEVSNLEAQGTAAAAPKAQPNDLTPAVKSGPVRGTPRAIPKDSDHAAAILARAGGIRDDEGHDLVKGRGLQQMVPGAGPLIRPKGMSIDAAGELLWNQGFWGPTDHTPRPTENQVLQLLERTRRGADNKPRKVYAPERQVEVDQNREAERVDEANQSALEDIHGYAKSLGTPLSDDEAHQVLAHMGEHGIDHESAVVEHIERQALRGVHSYDEEAGTQEFGAGLPKPGPAANAGGPAGRGASGQPAKPGQPGRSGEAPPENPPAPAAPRLSTEKGAEGFDQTIVPGAEPSAQQLAQAKEASGKGKIKPRAPQREAGGMFEEPEDKGPDMFAAKPAVTPEQAAEALKTNVDPRTGERPKGNAAVRALREEMHGIAEKDTKTPESVSKPTGDAELAKAVQEHLNEPSNPPMDQKGLMRLADEAYGGTAGQGIYDPRRAYDAMETGINQHIAAREGFLDPRAGPGEAKKNIARLKGIEEKLPIQSRRTGTTDAFQQFSTPPHYAYAAAWAANLRPDDVALEPSAGNGGLAVFAKKAGAKVVTNELSEGRRANLERQGFDQVTGHDAEQINNLLPKGTRPSVVLMNPPFSNAAERGIKDSNITGRHIDQALKTLAPGGRLVAITGHNFMESNSRNRPYFERWAKENRVKASVGVAGKVFSRYGTSYPTRVIIIDKAAPDGRPTVTGEADTAEALIDLLKGVRDERPDSKGTFEAAADQGRLAGSEPAPAQSSGEEAPGERGGPGGAVLPATGGKGSERPGSRRAEVTPPNDGVATSRPEGGAGASRDELHSAEGSEPGSAGRSEGGGAERGAATGQPDDGTGGGLPAAKSKGDVLNYEAGKTAAPEEELPGGVYSLYKPQRLVIAGAQPHPAELVQSAAMASVEPPAPSYKPALHPDVIKKGKLSEAQLEPVVYAGQAHEKMLPDGETRRGFFVGDGTGVGKGREISGVILDNLNQGRTKHVWVSEKWPLIEDAKRDWTGVGGDEKQIISGKKFKQIDAIAAPHGILFTTYDTLKGKPKKGTTGQTRVDQIVKWLGKDFDGVLAFDEAHNMANADAKKGKRGATKPAEKALAGLELQKRLPKARVLYVSATGATEVRNLAYADRLGLWGPGTAFPTKDQFMSQIEQGGVAAMELVARDLKQMGSYLARGLSFNGVEYGRLEHKLSTEQRAMYDSLAEAWQMVLRNIDKALEVTGGAKDGRTSSAAYSAFWGGHQRFFNQVLTSMQMPTALDAAAKDIKEGRSPVFQLVNTNEAATERALARVDEENTLEDLDLTPRDQLMQLVQHSFPVAAMERYVDENGNEKSRPVLDAAGNVVEDRDAVAIRDKVLDDLSSIRVPDGPLEYLLNRFGPDTLAEVTGRTRRVVERNGKRVIERRPGSANTAEADAFMSGKKKALVFSQAGGTGRSYHADKGAKNQARRVHYLLQPGWSAAPAIQGFGRTHRSNQTSKPLYQLTTTDVVGQKRFVSSIARRLDQLGALTKGERRSGGQGFFTEKDNLESEYAEDAVTRMVMDILQRKTWAQEEGLTPDVLTQQMGLRNVMDPRTGAINVSNIPDVTQFLNRLLSLKLDMQDKVFNAFDRLFEQNIEAARAAGTLDQGVEQLKADHITKKSEQVVHTDEDSGAQTKYIALQTKTRTKPTTWDDVQRTLKNRPGSWVGRGENGRTYLFTPTRPKTNERGGTEEQYRRIGTLRDTVMPQYAARQKFEELESDEAEKAWGEELDKVPEFDTKTEHMVTGALLPIWDRLPKGFARVMRARTDDGEALLGRLIPNEKLQETLKNLGATGEKIEVPPDELFKRVVQNGDTVTLANGWKLQRRTVAGEKRMRLSGPNPYVERGALERLGAQFERVGYEGMFFVPDNAKGREFLAKQLKQSPIVSLGDDEGPELARAYHGTPHDFDQFDTSAVGTGEGNHTYGWGLYFAGEKKVADYYRDTLSRRRHGWNVEKAIDSTGISKDAAMTVSNFVHRHMNEKNVLTESPEDIVKRAGWADAEHRDEIQANADKLAKAIAEAAGKRPGKTLQVAIKPDDSDFLSLDHTVQDQSPKVRAALEKIRERLEETGDLEEYEEQKNAEFNEWTGLEIVRQILPRMAVDDLMPHDDADITDALENGQDGKAASLYLQSLGIPGNKYLDAQSRVTKPYADGEPITDRLGRLAAEYIKQWHGQRGRIEIEAKDDRAIKAEDRPAFMQRVDDLLGKNIEWRAEGTHNYVLFDADHAQIEAELLRKAGESQFPPDDSTRRVRVGPSDHQVELSFTPKYDAARAELGDKVRARLTQLGVPPDVLVKIADSIRAIDNGKDVGPALGTYWNNMVVVALDSGKDWLRTTDHEAGIHALRKLGLIDEKDWQVLANKAPKWIKQYRIEQRYGAANLSEERKIEEAAAHAFEDRDNPQHGNAIKRLFRKIAKIYEAIRNALHGLGFRTSDDVFASINRGDRGAPRSRAEGRRAEPRNDEAPELSRADDEEEGGPDRTTAVGRAMGAVDKAVGHSFYEVGKALNKSAARLFPESIREAADAVQMAVTPMAAGSDAARATAKDFANQMRKARLITGRQVEYLQKTFKPDRLAAMWEAADEESVLRQQGLEPSSAQGLNQLSPDERRAVRAFQAESNELLRQAQDIGLFKGEGLPSYVPRMVVTIGADGRWGRMGRGGSGVRSLDAIGRNVKTTSPNLLHRKHLTTEETETAAQGLDASASVVKDFRTLPLAMGRLQEAIAGRTLIDRIKAMGRDSGDLTVSEGVEPNSKEHGGWFTLDHPAFKTYRPSLSKNSETGKWEIATDADGNPLFERVPLYIRRDFEGPLRAVLSQDSSKIYKAAMALKGKTMSVVMYSPLMHNAVIWGKAFPAAPLKLLKPLWRDADGQWHASIELYGRGRAAKNDPNQMKEALDAGLDPVGHRYFNQDISAIMEQPNIKPGRSWTAQVLGYVPGLFDRAAGDAVRRRIDQAGDVWHNKFLWDIVGDLQMGMFQHLRDEAIKQGNDEQTASRYAAHFSNRYAGALPIESMSRIARQTANMLFFSRSFTLTNLGAYKDLLRGLPKDVQAQIQRDKGWEALNQIQGAARRKAASLLLFDIFLSMAGLVLVQHAMAWLLGTAYHPPGQNEPDREHRALIGYQKDGTAIYARLPTGKVGEELQDWTTEPLDLTKRKLSPFAQAGYGLLSNDQGFGRKVYDPYDKSMSGYIQNIGRVAQYLGGTIAPVSAFEAIADLEKGKGDPDTNWLKIVAPMMGVTISKGAPGGPAVGQMYASKDEHEFQVAEHMPEIRQLIADGKLHEAEKEMAALGLNKSYQKYVIRVAQHPGARMSRRQMQEFMGFANPEDKAKMKMFQQEHRDNNKHSALDPADLGNAMKTGTLERFAQNETWTRTDAIRAAQSAGMPATAALLRDARAPIRPELREKVLGQAG